MGVRTPEKALQSLPVAAPSTRLVLVHIKTFFVALQAISFSFPVLFFKNALDAECLHEPLLRIEAVGKVPPSQNPLGLEAAQATPHSGKPEGVLGPQRRHLQSGEASTHETEVPSSLKKRRILSSTVLPLGLALDEAQAAEVTIADTILPSTDIASGNSSKLHTTAAFTSASKPQKLGSGNDMLENAHSRHLSSAPLGPSPWLLHERFGRDPQRQVESDRQCGTRAYLLADWDEQRKIASTPVSRLRQSWLCVFNCDASQYRVRFESSRRTEKFFYFYLKIRTVSVLSCIC